MPIDFNCSGCGQVLRVPDNMAGASAKCPKCSTIARVPAESGPPGGPASFGDLGMGGSASMPPPKPSSSPLAGEVNPYSTPQAASFSMPSGPMGGPIQNRLVEAGTVLQYAWRVWSNNLLLLIGVATTVMGLSWLISGVMGVAAVVVDDESLALLVQLASNLIVNVVSLYLGIGQSQICLKLARGQPAVYSDVFGGGPRFLPVLGTSIIAGVALMAGVVLCIIPGIILALMFWPFYYVVVEARTPAIESFGVARTITNGNYGTTIVLWLASIGIMLVGVLALCVGILAAAPLVSMMWATAYLMMSGQIGE